jgi:hypothetical protein
MHLLQVQPELWTVTEETGKAQSGVRCNTTAAVDDVSDPGRRDSNLQSERILGHSERCEKLLAQHFPRMRRNSPNIPTRNRPFDRHVIQLHCLRSVVVGYLDFMRSVLLPDEANSKLIIDSDAVLARPITLECLQPVPRRSLEVFEAGACLDLIRPSQCSSYDCRPFTTFSSLEELSSLLVAEALDHMDSI